MPKSITANALIDAGATALYVIGIATFLTYAEAIFPIGDGRGIIVPVVMLLIFVISAAVTGFLVIGRPVLWYLDGKKSEALRLFGYTLVALAAFALIALAVVR